MIFKLKFLNLIFFLFIFLLTSCLIFIFSLNSIVKKSINEYGSYTTKTDLNVLKSQIFLNGEGKLNKLTISNPKGFSGKEFFEVDDVNILIDIFSVFSKVLIIDNLEIIKPTLYFEINENGKNNIEEIIKNIESRSNFLNQKVQQQKNEKIEKKIILKQFIVTDATFKILVPKSEKVVTLGLSPIKLNNIGFNENGIKFDLLMSLVLKTIYEQLSIDGGNLIMGFRNLQNTKDKVKKLESQIMEKINDQLKEKLKNVF